jgi:hypothetical protein
MRRLLHGLAAFSLLATAAVPNTAWAQVQCSSPTDQSAFDVGALKSELTVLAVSCDADKSYNAFVERFRSDLVSSDGVVNAWFKRTYGKSAQTRYDQYITELINQQSQLGLKQGSDFCPRSVAMFNEIGGLPNNQALTQYVAGKDLIPSALGSCATQAVATTATRSAKPRGHAKH